MFLCPHYLHLTTRTKRSLTRKPHQRLVGYYHASEAGLREQASALGADGAQPDDEGGGGTRAKGRFLSQGVVQLGQPRCRAHAISEDTVSN